MSKKDYREQLENFKEWLLDMADGTFRLIVFALIQFTFLYLFLKLVGCI